MALIKFGEMMTKERSKEFNVLKIERRTESEGLCIWLAEPIGAVEPVIKSLLSPEEILKVYQEDPSRTLVVLPNHVPFELSCGAY